MSDALTWLLVKNSNAFLVKANGRTRRTGAVQFSRESGNLYNLNTFKYSGLANSKTVDLNLKDKTVYLTTKVKGKARKPAKATATVPLKKGFRKVAKTITNTVASNYYREDLKAAALARWTNLNRVAQIEKGVVKKAKVRRSRNVRS